VTAIFDGKKVVAAVYERDGLRAGRKLRGPAIVTEYSATTAVPPGKRFWIDRAGNLVIEI
jgi:N-methylhydantoinase A